MGEPTRRCDRKRCATLRVPFAHVSIPMVKLPVALSQALIEGRFRDAAAALAKAFGSERTALAPEHAYEFAVWPLLGTAEHGLPVVSNAVRNERHPLIADPGTAREALVALLPVVVPLAVKDQVHHSADRLWQRIGQWAQAEARRVREPTHTEQVASACVAGLLAALPTMERRNAQSAVDGLLAAGESSSTVHQALVDAFLQPESLKALAQARVALRPTDLAVREFLLIDHLEGRVDRAAELRALQGQQERRWEAVLSHPAGPDKLLRLDLNPVAAFQTLLNGFGDTPRRAAWLGVRLLPFYRARGKESFAQRLESLLDGPRLNALILNADRDGVHAFLSDRPAFEPIPGWSPLLQDAWNAAAKHALTLLETPAFEEALARVAGAAQTLTAHALARGQDPKLVAGTLRSVLGSWRQARDQHPIVSALASAPPTAPAERERAAEQVRALIDNAFLQALRAELHGLDPELAQPDVAELLQHLTAVPAPSLSPARGRGARSPR